MVGLGAGAMASCESEQCQIFFSNLAAKTLPQRAITAGFVAELG